MDVEARELFTEKLLGHVLGNPANVEVGGKGRVDVLANQILVLVTLLRDSIVDDQEGVGLGHVRAAQGLKGLLGALDVLEVNVPLVGEVALLISLDLD